MESPSVKVDLLITRATLLTMEPRPGDPLGILEDADLATAGETIAWLGRGQDRDPTIDCSRAQVIDGRGRTVLPGFVDCHTHAVFGGSRLEESLGRLAGESPGALEARGVPVGIHGTVALTRAASDTELYQASAHRLRRMLQNGTTTVEVKSGYALDPEGELRLLRIAGALGERLPLDVYPTFLGAHGWPRDLSKARHMDLVIKEMLPEVGRLGLARFCDVWCDDGCFTAREAAAILEAGRSHGLQPRIHTDAYSYIGGSDLAAEMGMTSADHLNFTPPAAARKLAVAGVLGVLLPGTDFAVTHPRPASAGMLKEAGVTLALATNCNPGTWLESMQFVMMLACRVQGMAPADAARAATAGGAAALGLQDRGVLRPGYLADLQVWATPDYRDAVYRLGGNLVERVIKRGRVVHARDDHKEGHG
jgi:imidazolonepropionase